MVTLYDIELDRESNILRSHGMRQREHDAVIHSLNMKEKKRPRMNHASRADSGELGNKKKYPYL